MGIRGWGEGPSAAGVQVTRQTHETQLPRIARSRRSTEALECSTCNSKPSGNDAGSWTAGRGDGSWHLVPARFLPLFLCTSPCSAVERCNWLELVGPAHWAVPDRVKQAESQGTWHGEKNYNEEKRPTHHDITACHRPTRNHKHRPKAVQQTWHHPALLKEPEISYRNCQQVAVARHPKQPPPFDADPHLLRSPH